MIRKMQEKDLTTITRLWLEVNIETHNFIDSTYWKENESDVKTGLAQAEVYVYELDNKLLGFIGLEGTYIAGIFVSSSAQSKGIGKELLNYAKSIKNELTLGVYAKNKRATHFYQREDFKLFKEKFDQENQEKELLMIWRK